MKNILLFFSVSRIGGAESNFIKISSELSTSGYRIFLIVVDNNGPLVEKMMPVLCDYEIIDIRNVLDLSRNVIKFKRFIRNNDIDIVLNFGLKVELFSRIFSKIFGVRTVISNIRSTDDWRKFYHTLLDKMTQRNVDLWISNSEAGANAFVQREGVDNSKIKVIYNFIDDFDIKKNYRVNIEKRRRYSFGILANIKNGKGFEDIVQVVDVLLKNKFDNFKFIIGGVDLTNGKVRRLYESHAIMPYIEFRGYIDNKEIFFKEIDVFILPTYCEGFPTSILESMFFGRPVISTNVGGIPELISNGSNGYIFEPGDTKGMAFGLIELCNSNHLYNKFRLNSFEVLNHNFTISNIIHQWKEVLS